MNSFVRAEKAIDQILHDSLYTYKVKHSNFAEPEPVTNQKHHGTVFLCFSKEALKQAHGILYTSKEGLHEVCWAHATHWTPNPMRYGAYGGTRPRQFFLQARLENTLQINTLVVDCDWHDQPKPELSAAFIAKLTVNDHLKPTLILNTPHGYQIYYILRTPAYVNRQANGRLPVIDVAQRIAVNLKRFLGQQLPQVDQGCNNFGFFRLPNPDNILYYHPEQTSDLAAWINWSKQQSHQARIVARYHVSGRQWTPTWYRAGLKVTAVPEGGRGQGLSRHNFVFTMVLGAKGSGQSQAQTLAELTAWNAHNCEPLTESELVKTVRAAFAGAYQGATTFYIRNLKQCYLNGAPWPTDHGYWYKKAKPRDQRVYSHLPERGQDLLTYLKKRVDPTTGYLVSSWQTMAQALKISSQSLKRLIDLLVKAGQLIYTTTGRGRAAKTYWSCPLMQAWHYQRTARQQLLATLTWRLPTDQPRVILAALATATNNGKARGLMIRALEIPE